MLIEKKFENHFITEWEKEYIDYNNLEILINKSISAVDNNKEKDLTNDEIKLESPSSSLNSRPNLLKVEFEDSNKFISFLDSEIKRLYFFYSNKERELYISINTHLHIRQNFDTFNIQNFVQELHELIKISELTKKLCVFIYHNMDIIRKNLKKFDNSHESMYNKIYYAYIQKKIKTKSSDLLYMLQFKIIDEVSAIIDDLINEIDSINSQKQIKTGALLSNDDFDSNHKNQVYVLSKTLKNLLYEIDDINAEFRFNFKEWTNILKEESVTYNIFNCITSKTSLSGLTLNINDNNNTFEYINKRSIMRKESVESSAYFSNDNLFNINISLFISFFYMMSLSIILPNNIFYIEGMNYEMNFSGLALAFTPLGSIFSCFIYNKLLEKSFKIPIIMAISFMLLSSISYILSSPLNSFELICLSRFLLGIGYSRIIIKNYIISYVPKKKISKYLLYFQISSLFGLATGPLISILIYFSTELFQETVWFNNFINSSWFIALLSLIVLISTILFYTEPIQSEFSILKDNMQIDERKNSISYDSISEREKKMIIQIDTKLGEINNMNQFSDTNLVSRNIEQIAWKENKTASYIYKCFIIFLFIIIVVRITVESCLVISPYYIYKIDKNIDKKLIAIFLSISLFLNIPSVILLTSYLSHKMRDRKILILLIIVTLICNIFVINTFTTSLIIYSLSCGILIILSLLLENVTSMVFSKIIPSNFQILKLDASNFINYFSLIARILGGLIFFFTMGNDFETINIIVFSMTSGLFLLSLILVLIFYSELRIKAIARILRTRDPRKYKPNEF